MHRTLPVKVNDLNSFLTCPQCKGYLIDAFTINECLHSFCKSCIIKYVKRKECCPICKVNIMKDRMNVFLKRDVNLQYVVYKLVPGLFKNEMKRRRIFYSKHPKSVEFLKKRRIHDKETVGELEEDTFLFDTYTDISLSIEYSETGLSEICDSIRLKDTNPSVVKSYLQCPASFTIESLKKFLSIKNDFISTKFVDIMYDDKPLNKELTLMDVAYIYAWRRTAPMRLFYRITKPIEENNQVIPAENLNSIEVVQTPLVVLNKIEINKIDQTIDHTTIKSDKMTEQEDKENKCKLETSLINENSEIKQSKSFKEDEHTSHVAEVSVNTTEKEENNHSNSQINQTIASNTHNENLTITAMVASIVVNKENSPTKQKSLNKNDSLNLNNNINKDNKENDQENLQVSKSIESSDLISNSDKENDDTNNNITDKHLIHHQEQQKQCQLLPNHQVQHNHHEQQNYYQQPSNIAQEQVNVHFNNNNNNFNENNNKCQPTESIKSNDKQKPLKPKKPSQKALKKKEALANNVNDSEFQSLSSSGDPTVNTKNSTTKKPKAIKQKQAASTVSGSSAQNPIDLSNKTQNSSSTPATDMSQQFHQQPHQQFAAAAAAAAAHFSSLPFNGKLNSQSGLGSTPPIPGMMAPNFQLMPNIMSHLMSANQNGINPMFNYANSSIQSNMMNEIKQAQVASALMNPKFNSSLLEYFQSKGRQSIQQNFGPSSYSYLPNHASQNTHTTQFNEDYKKPYNCFNSYDQIPANNYPQTLHSNWNADLMRNYNYSNLTNKMSNGLHQQDGQNFSSSSSSCSSNDISSLDSLKETQLRISESCNLVNESS